MNLVTTRVDDEEVVLVTIMASRIFPTHRRSSLRDPV